MKRPSLKTVLRGYVCFLAVLCLGCLWLFPEETNAVTPLQPIVATIKKNPSQKQEPELQYQATKKKLHLLANEPYSGANRSRWLTIANTFHQLYRSQRSAELAPSCLFMTAQVYRQMHDRFHVANDMATARTMYLELADTYPGHRLADDALFEAAALTGEIKDKHPDATTLYQKIVAQYPQGDQAVRAKRLLPPPSPPTRQHPAQSARAPHPPTDSVVNHFGTVAPPKFWSSEQYGRIVVEASNSVPFKVAKGSDQLPQVILDLGASTIDPTHCTTEQLDEGLFKKIRTSQPTEGTVRFQIDAGPYVEYKVFSLNNPFRIVLDVYGSPDEGVAATRLSGQEVTGMPTPKIDSLAAKRTDAMQSSIPFLQERKKTRASGQIPPIMGRREHLSLAQQLGLGVKTIVIDPGHGGKDPGAMAFGLKEKDIVLNVAKKLAKTLKENFHYHVILTRTRDVFIPLEQRTALANSHKADLFISIHVNAHGKKEHSGIETYFLNLATDADAMRVAALENASSTHSIGELQHILSSLMNNSKIDESSRLARFVQTNLINGLKNSYQPKDLGVKQAPFYVLIGAEMPAILAELSFITNPEEAKLLKNEKHLEQIAKQIAGGIVAYVDHHRAAAYLR